MEFHQRTLREFFDGVDFYCVIPEYQRGYEWDTTEKRKRNQVREFWEDLEEFIGSEREFPLGNVIVLKRGYRYEIVDGQQRLTTSIILIRSIVDRLVDLGEMERGEELVKRYIVFRGKEEDNVKFRPQQYDMNFWIDLIVDGREIEPRDCETPSQKRMFDAKKFFDRQLAKKFDEIKRVKEKIENAILGVIEISSEKEAASLFELQNDRGKELTDLDKIKAFFMHQIYVCGGNGTDIAYIYDAFKEIYRMINYDSFPDEDEILLYHIQAYTEYGYNYRNVKEFKMLVKKLPIERRVTYIREFSRELKRSFKNIMYFLTSDEEIICYLRDLSKHKFAFAYPFILKGLNYFRDKGKLRRFLGYLEKIVFVHNATGTHADIRSRLNEFLISLSPETNIDAFFKEIFKKLLEEDYWSSRWMEDELINKPIYIHHPDLAKYILKRYEIWLRKQDKSRIYTELQCMDINKSNVEDGTGWWIEHIAPQTPANNRGYGKYDDDFIENYLHFIGNLLLVSQEHNQFLGNRDFSEKIRSFKNSSMLHHREVQSFGKRKWYKNAIKNRTKKFKEFILDTWSLEKI